MSIVSHIAHMSRVRGSPGFAERIADAFVTPALPDRLGNGGSKHLDIEVGAHTLDDLALEERIRLGFAT